MTRSARWLNAVRAIPNCVLCGRHGTQAAHRDWGKGMGLKVPDHLTAALCPVCHDYLDNGKGVVERATRRAEMDTAIVRTFDLLVRAGRVGLLP